MSDYENDDECWSALESFRVKLISVIDPSRITPYLRQCKVLNPDDEEQVLSDPSLVIRKRKVGEGCSHTSRPILHDPYKTPRQRLLHAPLTALALPHTAPSPCRIIRVRASSPFCHVHLLLPSGGRGVHTIVQALRVPPE